MSLSRTITIAAIGVLIAGSAAAEDELQFNRDIRPILSDNCFSCHGPDANRRKGELRLDVREQALKPAESGDVAIVPGKPESSTLVAHIESTDPDELMPPRKSNKTLTPAQKEMLKRWIREGAAYAPHWAFVPPVQPALPVFTNASWQRRNAIDSFILARLEKAKLAPAPEADKVTLIRRLSLDLTGLPPTPQEVAAYVADQSPQAYETLVDRLLRSPRYGERMAVDWLDAARFADSNGYQVDRDREMYAWRDWVIRAFNDNKRFDQFTIEQIAGDLLPEATLDQRVATGFHRNHMINEEGGVIAEEFLAEYTADRVETTATVWLAQTFNCTRCHDHKFDPFTQRDFYSMKAFFNAVPEQGKGDAGADIRRTNAPFVELPAPALATRLAALNQELTAANQQREKEAKQAAANDDAWAGRVASANVAWTAAEILSATGTEEKPVIDEAKHSARIGTVEDVRNITLTAHLALSDITALRLECMAPDGATSLSMREVTVTRMKGGKRQPLKLRAADAGSALTAAETAKVLDRNPRTAARMPVGPARNAEAVFELEDKLTAEDAVPMKLEVVFSAEGSGVPTVWRVSATAAAPELLVPSNITAIAKKAAGSRTAAEKKQLTAFRAAQLPGQRLLADRIASLTKQVAAATSEIPTTLVMGEMAAPRPTFILMRGAYDKPGEAVTANTPGALPSMAADLPRNRLGLAKWLVDPRNPLPARVTVNRLWQAVFGTGLVRTSEDFGAQGEAPSHPELLDWLAAEFIRSGWDVKAMMKLLVTSATYRQSSKLSAGDRDPENRLLARGPRFRLGAEMVRDQALAVSGLLEPTIGGPSVKPYHPPGLYEQVVATRFGSGYQQGKGSDLHRRSLYTYWKRSVPHPAMLAFDAPFREACTLRRPRTNTPLQALNLMNDPTYVEAARFLAQRMIREGGADAAARLAHGFRLVLARAPRAVEMALLTRAYERALSEFRTDPAGAEQLLKVGDGGHDDKLDDAELAAFTTVASTLLCMDETITKQ